MAFHWQNLYKIDKVTKNRQAFGEKVISISKEMNINPNWLMGLMYFETAQTMSHTITNSIGCVGLIQFCSIARQELNVSAAQLKAMTNVDQLTYVRNYFMGKAWKRNLVAKVKDVVDLYLIIFYPLAAGKSLDYVLGSHNGTSRSIYNANPAFKDGTGKVKVRNVRDKILSFLPSFDSYSNVNVTHDNYAWNVNTSEVTVTAPPINKKPQKESNSSFLWIALLIAATQTNKLKLL